MAGLLYTDERIDAYFSHLVSYLGPKRDVNTLAVAHMVPNTVLFVPALNDLTSVSAVLPKPKSVNRPEFEVIGKRFRTIELSREWAREADQVVDQMHRLGLRGKKVVIVDIGGYFSESISSIKAKFDGDLCGVLEGTENGAKKYEDHMPHDCPVITVARSPLKLPEDYLVASSVVFSIEAVLREYAEILQTRSATVIGYGRVGSPVAEILRGRGISTVVHDIDPVKLAEAAAKGFRAYPRLSDALSQASLVVCATGNKALNLRGFAMLRSGCVVASVTSADDELDLGGLDLGYTKEILSSSITRYTENRAARRHFSLIAGGNAANFLHGAVIGPAIQLIEGEKLAAVNALATGRVGNATNALAEVDKDDRTAVAQIWNEHFL